MIGRLKSQRQASLVRLKKQARELENEVKHLTQRRLNTVSYPLRSVTIKKVLDLERGSKHTVHSLIEAVLRAKESEKELTIFRT